MASGARRIPHRYERCDAVPLTGLRTAVPISPERALC